MLHCEWQTGSVIPSQPHTPEDGKDGSPRFRLAREWEHTHTYLGIVIFKIYQMTTLKLLAMVSIPISNPTLLLECALMKPKT